MDSDDEWEEEPEGDECRSDDEEEVIHFKNHSKYIQNEYEMDGRTKRKALEETKKTKMDGWWPMATYPMMKECQTRTNR